MPDENTQEEEEFDWDELLEEFEPEVEQEEKKFDADIAKVVKNQRKIAERQAKLEAQAEREKIISEFYAKASEEEKEFADVLIAGVSEPEKVKRLLDLAAAKAKATKPQEEIEEEEDDSKDVEQALSAPVESSTMTQKDPAKERAERTRRGDVHAAFIEFMDLPATGGPHAKE